jgi:hypothetical protein
VKEGIRSVCLVAVPEPQVSFSIDV